jgi:glycosyltransferase involved in cell wall biosynthesis
MIHSGSANLSVVVPCYNEAVVLAGFQKTSGQYVLTMDADLQDPPSLSPQMLEVVRSGEFDCAGTRRVTRTGEPPVRSFFARKFYYLMTKISTKWFEYENIHRIAGETKWSFGKLVLYSIDGITAFSSKPLALASISGAMLFFLSLAFIIFIIIRKIIFGDPVAGWASTVCIILLCSGIQLFSIGILGQYLAKTYTEVKQRPHYIIREEK